MPQTDIIYKVHNCYNIILQLYQYLLCLAFLLKLLLWVSGLLCDWFGMDGLNALESLCVFRVLDLLLLYMYV